MRGLLILTKKAMGAIGSRGRAGMLSHAGRASAARGRALKGLNSEIVGRAVCTCFQFMARLACKNSRWTHTEAIDDHCKTTDPASCARVFD